MLNSCGGVRPDRRGHVISRSNVGRQQPQEHMDQQDRPSTPICIERDSGSFHTRAQKPRNESARAARRWIGSCRAGETQWTEKVMASRPHRVKICFVVSIGNPMMFVNEPC